VVAGGIDTVSGQRFRARLCPDHEEIRRWLSELPAPVAVAYEAGPTGFELARTLRAAGVRCEVAAPSKLQRPGGDRIKTDSRDAMHLARLLRMDEIVAVRVPSAEQEAARDLVRAREDARADVMRAASHLEVAAAERDRLLRRRHLDSQPSPLAATAALRLGQHAGAFRHQLRNRRADRGPPRPAGPDDHRHGH
jgi:transposase